MSYDGFISYSHAADDQLAPRLQAGLQRFAKPWWQRRALRIFRDESSLAANPHLWSSITDALDDAGWFVLLLSPDAAGSEWVDAEVAYWLEHREADRIIPVVTDGEFGWGGSDVTGDCVPAALRGAFEDEPRWVDARELGDPESLDLKNPEFAAVVADLAAPLRGVPKDELASEEVRQHKRTVRTAWAAGTALAVLAIAAAAFGVQASNSADEAHARELAAEAVAALASKADPQLAKLLSLEAILASRSVADQPALVDTLFAGIAEDRMLRTFETGHDGYTSLALSADDRSLALASESGASITMHDTASGDVIWRYAEEETSDRFVAVHFEPSGDRVAVSVEDSLGAIRQLQPDTAPNRLLLLDAATGALKQSVEYPDCSSVQVIGSGWSDDGGWFAVSNGWAPCPRVGADGGWWVEVLDGSSFESTTVIERQDPSWAQFAGDELFVIGWGSGTEVFAAPDFTTGRPVEGQTGPGDVSPDGSLISTIDFSSPTRHYMLDVDTGRRVEGFEAPAYPAVPGGIAFSPSGDRFMVQTEGNQTVVWDVATGEELFVLQTGRGGNPAMSSDGTVLYTSHVDGTAKAWDLSTRSVSVESVATFGRFSYVNGNHLAVGPELGAIEVVDLATVDAFSRGEAADEHPAEVVFFDPVAGEVIGDAVPASGVFALADGRFLLTYWERPEVDRYMPSRGVAVYDPMSGSVEAIHGCPDFDPGPCPVAEPVWVSVSDSGTKVMLRPVDGGEWEVLTADGDLVGTGSADQRWSWVSTFSEDWVLGYSEQEVAYTAVDADSGDLLFSLGVCGCREEVSPSGEFLATANGGEITIVALGNWDVTRIPTRAGHVRGMAFNADDGRLAVGDDRNVHVLDLVSGEVIQTIPFGGASDFHWLDDATLAVGTIDGDWVELSLATDDLIELALEYPGRGYTSSECEAYGIDPCPTDVESVRARYERLRP